MRVRGCYNRSRMRNGLVIFLTGVFVSAAFGGQIILPSNALERDAPVRTRLPPALTPAATHVLHVDVADPSGKPVAQYSGNLLAPSGRAFWNLPIAFNDHEGRWAVRVKDVLTGVVRTATVEVF